MRCLYCGKKTLLRKFSNGEFCSDSHRQIFFEEQQRLALARLAESEQALTAAKRRNKSQSPPTFLPFLLTPRKSTYFASVPAVAFSPALELWLPAYGCRPVLAPLPPAATPLAPLVPARLRVRANGGKIRLRAFGAGRAAIRVTAPRFGQGLVASGLSISDALQKLGGNRFAALGSVLAPLPLVSVETGLRAPVELRLPRARLVLIGSALSLELDTPRSRGAVITLPKSCNLAIIPRRPPIANHVVASTLRPPALLVARAGRPALDVGTPILAATGTDACRGFVIPAGIPAGVITPIPIRQPACQYRPAAGISLQMADRVPAPIPGASGDSLPVNPAVTAAVEPQPFRPELVSPARRSMGTGRLQFAAPEPLPDTRAAAVGIRLICRTGATEAPPALATGHPATLPAGSFTVKAGCIPVPGEEVFPLPLRPPEAGVRSPRAVEQEIKTYEARLRNPEVKLATPAPERVSHLVPPAPVLLALAGSWALQEKSEPLIPPASPMFAAPPSTPVLLRGNGAAGAEGGEQPAIPPTRKIRRWPVVIPFRIPAPLRQRRVWALAAAALMITVILRKPPEGVVAAASSHTTAGKADRGFAHQWQELRDRIIRRAAVNLQDDFRSGLSGWRGKANWAREWKYDAAGFVHTGSLALFTPSMSLNNYSLEFLGQIERRAIGWVVRAKDFDNYYAMKVVLDKPGPLPEASLVRYAVIDGKETGLKRIPLPVPIRSDSLLRIRMEVRGETFTTSIHGQVADFWTDRRLSRGGIGFFSGKGEQSRIRWVEVSHQYDILGRLCAWMAPNAMAAAEGDLNR